MNKYLRALSGLSIIKTIWFNFRYFPIKTALRFPAFVWRRTYLRKLSGNIVIADTVTMKPGLIKISPPHLGIVDNYYERTIWEQRGTLIINGACEFGRGSRISIGKSATLSVGPRFMISGKTVIICNHSISFGADNLLSWDVQVMDSDFHKIFSEDGMMLNPPKAITIGDKVWICSRATIMKGVSIADGCIVAAGALISTNLLKENAVYVGQGKDVRDIASDIRWED